MKNIKQIVLSAGMTVLVALVIPSRDVRAAEPDDPDVAPLIQTGSETGDANVENAQIDARYDATRQVSRAKWTSCGCVGIYLGVAASMLFVASPRIERLLGKSPEYVMIYTRTYKRIMRGQQVRWAALGCATTTCLLTAFLIASSSEQPLLDCGPDITCGLDDDCQTMVDNTNACFEGSQNCGATLDDCGGSIGDCSPDCSPDCNSPDCETPSCGSSDCGGSGSNCGGSDSNCGGSSSSCGSLTENADPEIPLQ